MSAIDRARLEETLVALLAADTQVPFGETEVQPGDERIVAAVQEVALPRIEALGPDEVRRHAAGDVAARFGPPGAEGLLIQTYIVSQHANLMDDANSGSIVDGSPYEIAGRAGVGQGATQNKGPMAAAFAAVAGRPARLDAPVWLAVNTEGKSSHAGSRRVLDELGVKARHAIVAFGTDLRISLGNRGRVDVRVVARGRSSHSSQPWLGANPIETAADIVARLRSLPKPPEHPDLGPVTATPYLLSCHPVAPHTIPETAALTVDRRLLPGERPEAAVDALRAHLVTGGIEVEVEDAGSMYPAFVDAATPVVRALASGLEAAGRRAETFFSLNAFDAGYACARGIPTPMFGPGRRRFAGEGLVGADAVCVDDCHDAASALGHALGALCASGSPVEP